MKKLSLFLSRKSLPKICKSFVRPNLGQLQGTSPDRVYQEIRLESLKDRG